MHRLLGSTDMKVGTLITYHCRHPVDVLCPINTLVKSEQTFFLPQKGRPSLDDLLDLPEEHVIDEPTPATSDASIVAQVWHEAGVERGEIIEMDDKDSESEDEEKSPEMTTAEVMKLCRTLETVCLSKGDST
ncbi:hypothetical protein B0H17DRAFT_1139845 [Mycena rosella]|uniref:Uncharacterized protein n=1 Tax=Mycena rosella TaxID=1033263 RepID=A0AAD7GC34_MYCRO|nr:hypothetical protein B0H17DRAFT_1139845 [Mycena rosella]